MYGPNWRFIATFFEGRSADNLKCRYYNKLISKVSFCTSTTSPITQKLNSLLSKENANISCNEDINSIKLIFPIISSEKVDEEIVVQQVPQVPLLSNFEENYKYSYFFTDFFENNSNFTRNIKFYGDSEDGN